MGRERAPPLEPRSSKHTGVCAYTHGHSRFLPRSLEWKNRQAITACTAAQAVFAVRTVSVELSAAPSLLLISIHACCENTGDGGPLSPGRLQYPPVPSLEELSQSCTPALCFGASQELILWFYQPASRPRVPAFFATEKSCTCDKQAHWLLAEPRRARCGGSPQGRMSSSAWTAER